MTGQEAYFSEGADDKQETLVSNSASPSPSAPAIVQRVWNYCHVLRDDGVSYGDYVEQLTYLIFLKMADEQTKPPLNRESIVPRELGWQTLLSRDGAALEEHYRHILETLARQKGMLGTIFRKSQTRIQDPAKLRRLVDLINSETWTGLDVDVKGAIYEGLLEKNAADVKSGAGQYFTPRPLIRAIVEALRPQPGTVICDPACGTGGFLIAAYDYVVGNFPLNIEEKKFLKYKAFRGRDIVDGVVRLCVMNLHLHGIGGDDASPIESGDSLAADPGERFDMVLTNPPFGRRSSITIENSEGGKVDRESLVYERQDFWASSSNKQLNFIQHVKTLLRINGKAAIVVPDNVLFEGGAGEVVRRKLLHECNVHTLLRLPTGIFYKPGVKANVLFFDRKPASEKPWTEKLWVYDFRTSMRFRLKSKPLRYEDLTDFLRCYNADNMRQRTASDRFRGFELSDLLARDRADLDIFWLKEESAGDIDHLPEPEELIGDALAQLEAASDAMNEISLLMNNGKRENSGE